MKPAEAVEQFTLLRAAYPTAKIGSDSAELWVSRLRQLEHALGDKAVQTLIDRCKFWPSLAELNECVEIVREQALRAQREAERRDADRFVDEFEWRPLREIPEAVALLERFKITPPASLEHVDEGPCDDCRRVRERCLIGRVAVCVECARGRLRVAERLDDEAA